MLRSVAVSPHASLVDTLTSMLLIVVDRGGGAERSRCVRCGLALLGLQKSPVGVPRNCLGIVALGDKRTGEIVATNLEPVFCRDMILRSTTFQIWAAFREAE